MTAVADLKRAHRATWAAGDYAAVAEHIDDAPPRDLLARVDVQPGQDVLDVATGTGNVAIRAAAAGAQVVGLDLTPELFDTARRRAAQLDVTVDWVEGDAEDLPFEDDRFDRVLSTFGVQFAPRHEIVARELVRVCRPGGRIGLVNWTPGRADRRAVRHRRGALGGLPRRDRGDRRAPQRGERLQPPDALGVPRHGRQQGRLIRARAPRSPRWPAPATPGASAWRSAASR
jgi:SAM-dependent methyltransferase